MQIKKRYNVNWVLIIMLVAAFNGLSIEVEAQSRKERDSLHIIEKAFYDIDHLNSFGKEILVKVERFDERGELIEEIEYEDNGQIKKHTEYQYRGDLLIRENEIDKKGKIKSSIEYEYDIDGLKIRRKHFDEKGKIIKERIYRYKKQ